MFSLTRAAVRAHVDARTFARGEAYWRDGQVEAVELDEGQHVVRGVVNGTYPYRVELVIAGRAVHSSCSCPVGGECKHVVAIALAAIDANATEVREVEAPASSATLATPADVERFARAHHVEHALKIHAAVLAGEVGVIADRWVLGVLSQLPLRDVASLQAAKRRFTMPGAAQNVAAAALRRLRAEAAQVELAIAEEAAMPTAASVPEAQLLFAKLSALRGEVRASAAPRPRAWRASCDWRFEPAQSALSWREPDKLFTTSPQWGAVAIRAQLAFPSSDEMVVGCSCGAKRGCAHLLALLDETLAALSDPARTAVARQLAGDLLRPSWDRALRALEHLDAVAAIPRAQIEVSWVIEELFGGPTLTPIVKRLGKRGWSAGARVSASRLLAEHGDVLPDDDRRIADALEAFAGSARSSAPGAAPVRALAAAVGHPRLYDELDHDRDRGNDRDGDRDLPIELARVALGFIALAANDQIELAPALDGTRIAIADLARALATTPRGEPLFVRDPARRRYLLVDVGDDARALWSAIATHGARFPPEAHARLLERLARFETRVPIHVPQHLKGSELPAELTVVVRLRLTPDVALELETFVRPGPHAPLYPPGVGPTDILIVRDGMRGYIRRQLATEQEHARSLLARLPIDSAPPFGGAVRPGSPGLAIAGAVEGPPGTLRFDDADRALAVVAALQTPPDGLEAEWIDARPYVGASPVIDDLRVRIDHKHDWFGIVGDVAHESGRIELAVLLDAARRQQRFVRTGDHRWIELSEALRTKLAPIADQTYARRDRVELSPGAVPAVQALQDAGVHVEQAPAWQQLAERLATASRLRPVVPAQLAATLRPYQIEGHAWLARVAAWGAGAVLADDMGLGKTVQAIAMLIDRSKRGPALVLAPTSVAHNWANELARFAPTLTPVIYGEADDRGRALAKLKKRDVVIASYGVLVRDIELLAAVPFATLILDEAQAVKNPSTQRARAARRLQAEFRLAMSGTPIENHLGELWSLYAIVFPGLLGSWEQFRARFGVPIERDHNADAREALARVLRPFLLRRTKSEVAKDLPAKTEIEVPIALSPEESALYEDARLAAIAALGANQRGPKREDRDRRFEVLAALTRLRLLASHPKLYDASSSVGSSKLRRLCELVGELRDSGHRALVFSQFTSHLALVRAALDAEGFSSQYLDGATTAPQRAKRIAAFQAGEGDVFLISTQAGGTGINLTAADYVIHLDPWWNPAVEDQATDRAHRIGQSKPVTVYRLVARGTIEERILALHGHKRALVSAVLDNTDVAAKLSTRDLLALLAGEAQAGAQA